MKYPYAVKANGKWYKPNEEIPETNTPTVEADTSTVEVEKEEEKKKSSKK